MPLSNYIPSSRLLTPGVCTSTTRPASPYEGQAIYETDTDMMAIWNGTAWRYIAATTPTNGTVLQVASTTKTDTFTHNTTTFTDITGLSVSITPKSSSSKIFVTAVVSGTGQTAVTNFFGRLVRDSTAIAIGDAAGSRIRATIAARDQDNISTMSIMYLDSPATTSSTTYKVQVRSQSTGVIYINRTATDGDDTATVRTVSTITAMEIAG
jgi:hypothetical protein